LAGDRINAGLLFDLLGHLGKDAAVISILREAELLTDPRPRLFAITSLIAHGEEPISQALLEVAQDAETRGILFTQLSALNKYQLFPKSELQQSKLAESDMVNWLTFPTELGRAPDHIELMKTVELDAGTNNGGIFVYYIFRFKTDPPHWSAEDEWMAGISGPFRKDDFPTMYSWGDTFSTFTKWDKFDADEHLSSIVDLMERWRAYHRKK
jgi:hypothetical protein